MKIDNNNIPVNIKWGVYSSDGEKCLFPNFDTRNEACDFLFEKVRDSLVCSGAFVAQMKS